MDTRSVLERLSEAKTSTDLSHRPTRCDVDYVAALGAAGIKHPAGSAILDADLTRDPDTLKAAYRATEKIVKILAQKRNWMMSAQKLRTIATAALKTYMLPACPACKGRGFTGVETISSESLIDCPDCHGEGHQTGANGLKSPCGTCQGKGRVTEKAKPKAYAPKPCVECGGTGKRKIQARYHREIRDVLTVMESQRRAAGVAVRKQMGLRATEID